MKSDLQCKCFEEVFFEDLENRVNKFITGKEVVFPQTHIDRQNGKIVVVIWYREEEK